LPNVRLPANGWKPRGYQVPLWRYLERGGREAVAVWHRRSGKDEIALHRTAVALHERVGNYWHMLPQYEHARKALWNAINPHTGRRRIDESFPVELRKRTDNQGMLIEFRNGSMWQLVGSDNYDSLLGAPPVGIVFSEWAVADPRAQGFIRPILLENGGWSLYIYTDRGYNHGWSTYEGALKRKRSFAQRLTVEDTGIFTAEALAEELQAYKDDYGDDAGTALFRQEYYCDFSAASLGSILGSGLERAEAEGRLFTTMAEYDPTGPPVFVSSDIGFHDAAAFWYWQPRVDGVALVHYEEESGFDADDWVVKLQEVPIPIDTLWLPHDARARTFQTKRSAVETFLASPVARVIRVLGQSRTLDRINAARRMMRLCWFAPGTERGVNALRNWQFEYNAERKMFSREPLRNWATHGSDGFSYGAQIAPDRVTTRPPMPLSPGVRAATSFRLDDFALVTPRAPRL